jgi:hypothetical protein
VRRGAAGASGLGPLERSEADEAADWYDSLGSGAGGARSAVEGPPSGRSKTVAALLAVFMPSGMFGLHRFLSRRVARRAALSRLLLPVNTDTYHI